jgi:hypothetical protein
MATVVGVAEVKLIEAAVEVTGVADTVYPKGLLEMTTFEIVADAVTVSAPIEVPAFKEIVATPDAFVSAVPPLGKKVP